MFKNAFGILQKIGKALMLPVALLPAAGLLLGIGNAIQQPTMLDYLPILNTHWIQLIASVMEDAGSIIFGNLPLIFAAGVAIGLAGDGAAALAALVGYLVLNQVMSTWAGVTADMVAKNPGYATVLGIPTLQTGVFGGIIVGLIAAYCYNRFHNIEMPAFLGFFAGKRFVPIVTAATSLVAGLLLLVIWPPIQHGMNNASEWLLGSGTYIAVFFFGFIKRLLIPFGLHHIYYAPFWYEFGSYKTIAGDIVRGDMTIFFAQLKDNVKLTAGYFMGGEFPVMMFGLPAAALAMYRTAKPEKKKLVAGLLGSAALTSFLTGITEPIEFSFLFVSPLLFFIHAVLDGLSFVLLTLFKVHLGYTFSGGAIDFVLFGILPGKERWWVAVLLGLVFAVIYYTVFRFTITKLNLKTPGREDDEAEAANSSGKAQTSDLPYQILAALGGENNIAHLDACITRLRVSVNDSSIVNKHELKQLGAAGVLEVGNNIQAIFGPRSEMIKSQMSDIMSGKKARTVKPAPASQQIEKVNPETVRNEQNGEDDFAIPIKGVIMPITEVPDLVFAEKMMGDGFAIVPEEGIVVSPVDGKITNLFATKHALGILSTNGREILIHVGLDTVNLKGVGFESLVAENTEVKQGQPLLKFDIAYIKEHAKSTITPIVFTNLSEDEKVVIEQQGFFNTKQKGIVNIKK
ncbi:glucose-specific PTS transporter subunit IIBC [Bacillus rubiinfantis]|uniref:glucose-specific PTS transporter subunit IIBC n=1 Tax=Bacillus rubiinfantis TaxID=1499680 RepID=UPI0005A6F6AB|nr:glucose-specific PTS transporter subunit IIBC [Bacillus rubiinfantis]